MDRPSQHVTDSLNGMSTPSDDYATQTAPNAEPSPPPSKKQKLEPIQEDKKDTSQPFKDCNITFAVDVSASTSGSVLEAEKQAIIKISSHLNRPAMSAAKIVPWSTEVQPAVPLSGVPALQSQGGTIPSKLCSSRHSITTLRQSSLWFLMTDGKVHEREINQLANAVPRIHLHGTAAVFIIFGRRPALPKDADISVGFSVFAVVPHSVILFHDILTDDVWVLAAKGCFEVLLPRDNDDGSENLDVPSEDEESNNSDVGIKSETTSENTSNDQSIPEANAFLKQEMKPKPEESSIASLLSAINPRHATNSAGPHPAQWSDYPQISYADLTALHIPAPMPLSVNQIALSSGHSVSITDVLNNTVPRHQSFAILSNDSDRDTLLATASSRGLGARAHGWLRAQDTPDAPDQVRRSVGAGRQMLRSSECSSHSSVEGLGSRGFRSRPNASRGSNLSTAETLVGEEKVGSGSSVTVVGEQEGEWRDRMTRSFYGGLGGGV